MIDVREIISADIDAVVNLIYQSITISNAPDYHPDVIEKQSSIFTRPWVERRMKERYMLVATIDDTVVGTGTLDESEIRSVYVLPAAERQGVGRTIMKNLENKAIQKGYSTVHLGSSKTAVEFYEKLGYTLTEQYPFNQLVIPY